MNLRDANLAMRKQFHDAGAKGAGIIFAVLDTGVKPVGILKGKVQGDTVDKDGHGTFVAGQLLEWCPEATIRSYHVVGGSATNADILAALDDIYAWRDEAQYIVNMSISGYRMPGSADTQKYEQAINRLVEANIPVVVAAGNDGGETKNLYPSCFASPITVSAIDQNFKKASFSTFHNEVDFADLGVSVDGIDTCGGKMKRSGTSFACPQVAGKVGLLLSAHRNAMGSWLREPTMYDAMKCMAVDIGAGGRDPYFGWGWVDITGYKVNQNIKEPEAQSMTLLDEFIVYLEDQVKTHSIYVWGAQGQTKPVITEAWIKSRETSAENAQRAIAFWKKQVAAGFGDVLRAFDCSGLGMYWLQNIKGLYKGDMSSGSMRNECKAIARADLRRGDWVFREDSAGKTYHIGYVVDDALNVIEAKGRDDGVVKRPLNASGASYWEAYGRPHVFAQAEPEPSKATVLRITSPLMRGDEIAALQRALNELGYDCGTADGVCGQKTINGVRAFAAAHMEG